ncbi:hypothetical protein [Salinibaculum salinum]|uniref:hypothetical protein n=1 Tax=Salinibaculum salinum TaxID=3131996 RepID=UPI0030ED6418
MRQFKITAEIDAQTRAEMQGEDPTANPYTPIHVSVKKENERHDFDPFVDYATLFFISSLHALEDIAGQTKTCIREKESMDFLSFEPQSSGDVVIGRPVSEERTQRDPEKAPELRTITLDCETVSRGILSSAEEFLDAVHEINADLQTDHQIQTLSHLLEDKRTLVE